jgi:hypothetical protein
MQKLLPEFMQIVGKQHIKVSSQMTFSTIYPIPREMIYELKP